MSSNICDNDPGTQPVSPPDPKDLTPTTALAGALIIWLEGVIPCGQDRWYARCPAHDDRSPSLSIHDTEERVLIHCHTGCAPEDVLTAVGLEWKDLFQVLI